jgi:hypothetical protein
MELYARRDFGAGATGDHYNRVGSDNDTCNKTLYKSKETEKDMANRSPILIYARKVLQDAIDRIDRDECNPEEVAHMIEQTNAESKGYFSRESFVNYDEAMRILGIRNRVTLKATLDRYGVKMQKVNNQRVGFLRSEVEAILNKK